MWKTHKWSSTCGLGTSHPSFCTGGIVCVCAWRRCVRENKREDVPESVSNRRDSVSICDPLTLSGLQSGFSWPVIWFCGLQKNPRGRRLMSQQCPTGYEQHLLLQQVINSSSWKSYNAAHWQISSVLRGKWCIRDGKWILYPGKQDLRASPRLQRKKCNRTWTSTISAPNREPSYHPPSLPPANISLQLRGPQNERRFHFKSVISRPVCYLCGDKCLTDWECR